MGRQIARGSALFSDCGQLADDVRAGRLVLLDVDDALLRNSHAVYHRRDRPLAPAAALFRTLLRELEQELPQLADARRSRLPPPAPPPGRRLGPPSGAPSRGAIRAPLGSQRR